MIDLKRLRYFAGVAEHGGFHRASIKLNIAQPALTRQIHQLEEDIGVTLFIRSAQGAKLSPAGDVLLSEAKRLLPQVELAASKAKRAAMGQFGLMRIAFAERVAEIRSAVAAFADVRRLLPDIDFRLVTMNSDNQLTALFAGDLDVGVLYRSPPYPSSVKYRNLSTRRCKLLVNSKHPLAKAAKVRLVDLQSYDMALVARTVAPIAYSEVMVACARGGLSPRITFEVNSEAALINLVLEGIAIGFADPSLAERRSTRGMTFLTVEDFNFPLHLTAMWLSDRETPATIEFVDRLFQRNIDSGKI